MVLNQIPHAFSYIECALRELHQPLTTTPDIIQSAQLLAAFERIVWGINDIEPAVIRRSINDLETVAAALMALVEDKANELEKETTNEN